MPTNSARKKQFRTIGHKLNPIVTVSDKGLTKGVLNELNRALDDHELIKIKLSLTEREDRKSLSVKIGKLPNTEVIHSIGKTLLLYRAGKKPDPRLSNLLR